MTDYRTTELLPCPWCGGEATVERIGKSGYYYVACNTAYCCDFGKFHTEAEAIAAWNTRADYHGYDQAAIEAWESIKAWNTRAELGSERHPYEQRITGDGSDWGEIMRGAYDDLMASACESCTPEQMEQLANHIRAELGSGTCDAIFDKDYYVGINGVCESLKCSSCENPLSAKFRHCPWCGARIRKAVER